MAIRRGTPSSNTTTGGTPSPPSSLTTRSTTSKPRSAAVGAVGPPLTSRRPDRGRIERFLPQSVAPGALLPAGVGDANRRTDGHEGARGACNGRGAATSLRRARGGRLRHDGRGRIG